MWTLISGYIISIIFEYLTTKLHKNNFSNKNMSIFGIILGWLFQEHIKQDFNMTGGKRFMLKQDFRNRFITQSLKVIRNSIFWIHVISIFELGTFLLLFFHLIYFLLKYVFTEKYFNETINSFNRLIHFTNFNRFDNLEVFITTFFLHVRKIVYIKFKDIQIILSFIILFKYGFLKIYSWFDIIFVIRPFFFCFFVIFASVSLFWLIYLLYFFIIVSISKNMGYFINLFMYKNYFYIIFIYFLTDSLIIEINSENLAMGNFFKELLFKLLFFYF